MFDERPKLHWKLKIIAIGLPIINLFLIVSGGASGEKEFSNIALILLVGSAFLSALILHIYFRDLRAFEDYFQNKYGITYEEYKEKLRKSQISKKRKMTSEEKNLFHQSNRKLLKAIIRNTFVQDGPISPFYSKEPEQEPQIPSAPNSTIVEQIESGYQGRPGSLSFQEVSARREKMQPVYVAARRCYGIIERDEDIITLEDGKKISLYGAFFSGLYDHETDEEHLDMSASPEGALSYRQLIRMDRRPVYVPKFDSWGSINVEEQEIWFNKSVVPYAYGKTNRIGLYEASKLGVYEEDITK